MWIDGMICGSGEAILMNAIYLKTGMICGSGKAIITINVLCLKTEAVKSYVQLCWMALKIKN